MAVNNQKLILTVLTRRGVIFDQEVLSLTSYNDTGRFDVLQEHAQFISIIKDKIIARLLDGRDQQIPVSNGIMRVKGEKVEVFLGIKQ